MIAWFVENVLRPVWIVNEFGEMGIRVLGVNLYYYKWDTPLYTQQDVKWRVAYKREFGECVHSRYGFKNAGET